MATNPTPAATAKPETPQVPASGFQPAYKRVAQAGDFDCAFACIATICNKTLADVRQVASERFKIPKHGPYVWMDQELVASLLKHWSYAATVYEKLGIDRNRPLYTPGNRPVYFGHAGEPIPELM